MNALPVMLVPLSGTKVQLNLAVTTITPGSPSVGTCRHTSTPAVRCKALLIVKAFFLS